VRNWFFKFCCFGLGQLVCRYAVADRADRAAAAEPAPALAAPVRAPARPQAAPVAPAAQALAPAGEP
jgi:hypothetical protein